MYVKADRVIRASSFCSLKLGGTFKNEQYSPMHYYAAFTLEATEAKGQIVC